MQKLVARPVCMATLLAAPAVFIGGCTAGIRMSDFGAAGVCGCDTLGFFG